MPRRCAPRNDMQKFVAHTRCKDVLPRLFIHPAAPPCTRAHVLPSACHCEPVRTLVWQSASPQGNLASWLLFGQIRDALRMRPKYYFLSCLTAGSTDCHVASLLAMTMGGRPCTRRHAPAFRTPCAPNILAPAHTSFLLHVIANQCAHWCGNPFSPQRSLASWLLFGQIRDALRMRPKCCYFAMPHRRRSGLPRRFAPRNDMQKHAAVRMSNYVLPGQIRSFYEFA